MALEPEALRDRISTAAQRLDRAEVGREVDSLVALTYQLSRQGDLFPTAIAATILGDLRRKRYFEEMEKVADALLDCGQEHPTVQRQYLQALIDRKLLAQARGEVERLIEASRQDPKEFAEARGLKGRILKQSYVDAGEPPGRAARQDLASAIQIYAEVYQEDPARYYWHGINVVACLERARRDGVDPRSSLDPELIARAILNHLTTLNRRDPWNLWAWGTAMESCLALDRIDEARNWLEIYLQSPLADAFEFSSTYRQLVEVWQLEKRGGPASDLLVPLRAAVLRATGGQVDLQGGEPVAKPLSRERQARFGPEGARQARWIDELGRKFNAVARVEKPNGSPVGTGFLVRGEELREPWRGRKLLLTNAHVIDDPAQPDGLTADQARVRFTRHASGVDGRCFRLKQIWSSPPESLDVSIHHVDDAPDDLPSLLLARPIDIAPEGDEETPRLIVIGHPAGREMEVSIYGNFLKEVDDPLLFYRSPTEKGSSGSPVLTEEFSAVAIHRAANYDREANEGVLASALKLALREKPPKDL